MDAAQLRLYTSVCEFTTLSGLLFQKARKFLTPCSYDKVLYKEFGWRMMLTHMLWDGANTTHKRGSSTLVNVYEQISSLSSAKKPLNTALWFMFSQNYGYNPLSGNISAHNSSQVHMVSKIRERKIPYPWKHSQCQSKCFINDGGKTGWKEFNPWHTHIVFHLVGEVFLSIVFMKE